MTAAVVKGPWGEREHVAPTWPDDILEYKPMHALLFVVNVTSDDPLGVLVGLGFKEMAVAFAYQHALLGGLLSLPQIDVVIGGKRDTDHVIVLSEEGRKRLAKMNEAGERRTIKKRDERQGALL